MPLITRLIKFTTKRFYLARDTPINNTVLSHYMQKRAKHYFNYFTMYQSATRHELDER